MCSQFLQKNLHLFRSATLITKTAKYLSTRQLPCCSSHTTILLKYATHGAYYIQTKLNR